MKNMINAIAKYIASPFLVLFSNGIYLLILSGNTNQIKHNDVDNVKVRIFIVEVSKNPWT